MGSEVSNYRTKEDQYGLLMGCVDAVKWTLGPKPARAGEKATKMKSNNKAHPRGPPSWWRRQGSLAMWQAAMTSVSGQAL